MPTADERQQVRAIVQGIGNATSRVVAKVTLDLAADLIGSTPVDTGWARANWVPRIGAPAESTVGSPESVSASAQAAGQAAVLSYKVGRGPVFVTNNVPYIEALNEGHSSQEPAGFVQRAIRSAVTQNFGDLGRAVR